MENKEKLEALQNIELIREIVTQTKKEMHSYRGGWICIAWGIFCFFGMAGQQWFISQGYMIGIWWTALSAITAIISFLIAKSRIQTESGKYQREFRRWLFVFWGPLLILAYTLCLFCVFLPGLSKEYITIFMLLVVSTGYMMLGFGFFRDILFMGILGMISTIVTAVFFLEYSNIILSTIFGLGLIITGLIINHKWKE